MGGAAKPRTRLTLFVEGVFYPGDPTVVHSCIASLVAGPRAGIHLADMWEPQIVLRYQPDSLGYEWAALSPFLRAGRAEASTPTGRPVRKGGHCPGTRILSPLPAIRQRGARLGGQIRPTHPSQALDLQTSFQHLSLKTSLVIEVIDDGGLQLYEDGSMVQVAMLEGKQTFQALVEGKPIVSDQLLAKW